MALGVFLLAPLPLDGDWMWGDYFGPPWLGFVFGIPIFLLGLWLLAGGLRTQSARAKPIQTANAHVIPPAAP